MTTHTQLSLPSKRRSRNSHCGQLRTFTLPLLLTALALARGEMVPVVGCLYQGEIPLQWYGKLTGPYKSTRCNECHDSEYGPGKVRGNWNFGWDRGTKTCPACKGTEKVDEYTYRTYYPYSDNAWERDQMPECGLENMVIVGVWGTVETIANKAKTLGLRIPHQALYILAKDHKGMYYTWIYEYGGSSGWLKSKGSIGVTLLPGNYYNEFEYIQHDMSTTPAGSRMIEYKDMKYQWRKPTGTAVGTTIAKFHEELLRETKDTTYSAVQASFVHFHLSKTATKPLNCIIFMRLAFDILGVWVRKKSLLANDISEVYYDTGDEETHKARCNEWLNYWTSNNDLPIHLVPAGNGITSNCGRCDEEGNVTCDQSECPRQTIVVGETHPCNKDKVSCKKPCPTCRQTLGHTTWKGDSFLKLIDFLKRKNGANHKRFELFCNKDGDVFPLEPTHNVYDSLQNKPEDYEFHETAGQYVTIYYRESEPARRSNRRGRRLTNRPKSHTIVLEALLEEIGLSVST